MTDVSGLSDFDRVHRLLRRLRDAGADPHADPASFRSLLPELEHAVATFESGRALIFQESYHPVSRDWDALPSGNPWLAMIAPGAARYRELLSSFNRFADVFAAIPFAPPASGAGPFWTNTMFSGLDAVALYGLIATRNPRYYVEIGSGNSTKFARKAIKDHGLRTRILSIDPLPRADIDALCDTIMRQPLESVDLTGFEALGAQDMLFVDVSHRSFQNSDVTVFFTEILPRLGRGCLYGVHDIFLPLDYPTGFHPYFFNEQYLLMTYLLGGAGGDRVVLPIAYCANEPELMRALTPITSQPSLAGLTMTGGAFWMTRA